MFEMTAVLLANGPEDIHGNATLGAIGAKKTPTGTLDVEYVRGENGLETGQC